MNFEYLFFFLRDASNVSDPDDTDEYVPSDEPTRRYEFFTDRSKQDCISFKKGSCFLFLKKPVTAHLI